MVPGVLPCIRIALCTYMSQLKVNSFLVEPLWSQMYLQNSLFFLLFFFSLEDASSTLESNNVWSEFVHHR